MTNNSRKIPLTPEQERESDLLKAIYKKKASSLKITQEKIASALGEGVTQGAVSHYMNRRLALNAKAASVFARMLECRVHEFSPRLAKELFALTPNDPDEAHRPSLTQVEEPRTPYALVVQHTARAAAGSGHDNTHVEVRGQLAFKEEWIKSKRLVVKHLDVIYADGDSMSPTIADGDVLLVDTSVKEPRDGCVFALNGHSGTIVKRLARDDSGAWALVSDNLDKRRFPDKWLAESDGNEMTIVGRVIWRGGDL